MSLSIRRKRVYEDEASSDGFRVLVDRVWPRGLAKDRLHLDAWCKDLAPSAGLRKWFGHKVERWPEFADRYRAELQEPGQREGLRELLHQAGSGPITLLYGAKDTEHNQAVILAQELARAADSEGL